MDHKTLFPLLEMGFFFLDILMKHAIWLGCRLWQEIVRRDSVKFGADLEHICNIAVVERILIYLQSSHI